MNRVVVGVVVLVAGATAVPVVAAANEPPLADAGLDRVVDVGEEVRLDATGSRDPDGSIRDYAWEVETPNGTVRDPACGSCARTWFVPTRIGRYNVTVTVTDDDGASRSDTLYVTAEPGRGPTVSLSGSIRPSVGSAATYVATAAGRGLPLDSIEWTVNGSEAASGPLSGTDRVDRRNFTFESEEPRQVRVSVTDVAGQRATDSVAVDPQPAVTAAAAGGGGGCSTNVRTRSPVTRMDCGSEEVSGESTQVLRVGSGDGARFVRIVTEISRIEGADVQPVVGSPEGEDTVVERETQIRVFEDRSGALLGENNARNLNEGVNVDSPAEKRENPLLTQQIRQVAIGEDDVLQEIGMDEFEANLRSDGEEIFSEDNLPEGLPSGEELPSVVDDDESDSATDSDSGGGDGGSSSSGQSESNAAGNADPVGSSGPGGHISPGDVGDSDPDGSRGSSTEPSSDPVGSSGPGGHIGPGMGPGI